MKSVKLINELMVRSDGTVLVIPSGTKLIINSNNKNINESADKTSRPPLVSKENLRAINQFVHQHKRFTPDFFDKKLGFQISENKLTIENAKDLFHIFGYKIDDCGTHFQLDGVPGQYAFGSNVLSEDESNSWIREDENDVLANARLRLKYLSLRKLNPGLSFVGSISESLDNHICIMPDGNRCQGDDILDNLPPEWIGAAKEEGSHVLQFVRDMGLADYDDLPVSDYLETSGELAMPSNVEDEEITADDLPL